jgi:hypothetical protein
MERPRAFVVELGPGWKRWAKHRSDIELEEINQRLEQLVRTFAKPQRIKRGSKAKRPRQCFIHNVVRALIFSK